ncbi:hypothetical protein ASPZODRAFT_33732, partial [Penicilliopsis zonata CBS 506.65]
PSTLNITVLTAHNNQSTLECWSLDPGFTVSAQAGTSGSASLSLGALGGSTNATYVVIPGRYDGGQHNAPTVQWVVFLSGLAHITLPHSIDDAWILGGEDGVILALDTAAVSDGHITTYPSNEVTVALELPIAGSVVPEHRVLYSGACNATESL